MRTRRRFSVLIAVVCVLGLGPSPVAASIFGEEDAILASILQQDIAILAQAVKTVQNTIESVRQLQGMVQRADRMLKHADGNSILSILSLASSMLSTYRSIDRDVRYIGYRLESVDDEQKSVYDSTLHGVPPSQFTGKYRDWNGALLESTRVAMRTQTNINTLQVRAEAQSQILRSSQSSQGIVGQLQLVVQNIALLHSDLEAIQRSLDTGMRVTANMAAGQASTSSLVDEQQRLSLENYTDPGPAVAVPDKLP